MPLDKVQALKSRHPNCMKVNHEGHEEHKEEKHADSLLPSCSSCPSWLQLGVATRAKACTESYVFEQVTANVQFLCVSRRFFDCPRMTRMLRIRANSRNSRARNFG